MPRSITLELAGKTYEVTELKSRDNAAWREQLAGPFRQLASTLSGLGSTELTPGGIGAIVTSLTDQLLRSPDLLVGLILDYAPELKADAETIKAECYDSEILQAFTGILGLAYPFGPMLGKVASLVGSTPAGSKKTRTGRS